MTHLFLSHLSKENNRPELVKQLFDQQAEGVEIVVASRHEATAVYTIQHPALPGLVNTIPVTSMRMKQMSLF